MELSWFAKVTASSSKSSFLSNSTHELPRWREPHPMSASIIPPPIVQSVRATSSSRVPAPSVIVEPPTAVSSRQGELEADLQFLLDAQAEGLVRGLEGGGLTDDRSSTGSTTPTAQSVRSASARRTARPLRKKPGLRSARKGIYNSILALSAVKDTELQSVDEELEQTQQTLAQIDEWEQKRQGLQEATRGVDDSEETIRAQRLRQEADVLQEKINAVELQLADLKSRQRKLLRQAAEAENTLQARLASYTSSLAMVEADVDKFLSGKPREGETRRQIRNGSASMWELPAKRRTLDLARQQCMDDKSFIEERRQAIEYEKQALNEGAHVWKDVVERVTRFEKSLRASVADMSSSRSAWEDPPSSPLDHDKRAHDLLQQLDDVTQHLETQFGLAEERHWTLLVAAIGAELDALRQGRQILQSVLGVHADDANGDLVDPGHSGDHTSRSEDGNEIHELDKSFQTNRKATDMFDSSEDDPDPELMFSRQESGKESSHS